MEAAHRAAYDRIHATDDAAMVGSATAVSDWRASSSVPGSSLLCQTAAYLEHGRWIEATIEESDYLGINHYTPIELPLFWRGTENRSDLNWDLDTHSLRHVVEKLSSYDAPLIVTEHGVADATDNKRQQLIDATVADIEALRERHDIRGYLHWSLLDNFEWSHGFWPRFGLIHVDYENDRERHPRKSADLYRQHITSI